MEFAALVKEFAQAVEAGDGRRLAALFTADGTYHDSFYGACQGSDAIRHMLEGLFHRDGERFRWEMLDAVAGPGDPPAVGYARWRFSYTAKVAGSAGRRVAAEGMSCFELEGGRIRRYTEGFNAGIALAQLGFAPDRMARLFRRWAEEQNAQPALAHHLRP
ncbi:MAG: nuclear transport factor 2 family protein [Candidatus Lambdaproteobacteria bacterium]|nr:nuclear transport factor 2 family protein [Candidatus Lambdaproteobacteria bacterium]